MRHHFKNYTTSGALVLVLLILWEAGAQWYNKSFVWPSPTEILSKLWELRDVLIFVHLPATFLIIAIGLGISILLGVTLAIWMDMSKAVEKAIYPLLIASQTIPIIALAPIFILWFGYSIWSKVVVTVLITFFPITVSTFDGLRSANKDLKELLLTMGATKKDVFFKLNIPSALPYFLSEPPS